MMKLKKVSRLLFTSVHALKLRITFFNLPLKYSEMTSRRTMMAVTGQIVSTGSLSSNDLRTSSSAPDFNVSNTFEILIFRLCEVPRAHQCLDSNRLLHQMFYFGIFTSRGSRCFLPKLMVILSVFAWSDIWRNYMNSIWTPQWLLTGCLTDTKKLMLCKSTGLSNNAGATVTLRFLYVANKWSYS